MRSRLLALAAAAPLLLGLSASVSSAASAETAAAAAQPCGTRAKPAAYSHVVWIWMENRSYTSIAGSSQAPYINSLAAQCGLATNYHNLTHPSLPNYLGATSGLSYWSLLRYITDCNVSVLCNSSARSIFGQGETWKAYEESMSSNCAKSDAGEYAVRHDPPPYYTSLPGCQSNDVPYSRLASDLANNKLPAFSFITPNLIDDMHDGTTADGDKWLSSHLPAILNSRAYTSGSTVVFITFDEGEGGIPGESCSTNTGSGGCRVVTVVVSPSTKPGTKSGVLFNHYSLLGTTEQLLHLPKLGEASSAATMISAFNL